MICFIALFVFAVLSVFSASYRPLAKRAFSCVFRRITLRPCDSGLDTEVKSKILAKLLDKSPKAAKLVNQNFEAISWFFTFLMFASMFFTAQGLWNWYYYGNCNGPQSTEFCIFNAFVPRNDTVYPHVANFTAYSGPLLSGRQRQVEVIEFGCFTCPYTKQAEDLRGQILQEFGNDVDFYYRNFPLPNHPHSRDAAIAAQCALRMDPSFSNPGLGTSPSKYWQFHSLLFDNQAEIRNQSNATVNGFLASLATSAGYSSGDFLQCLEQQSCSDCATGDVWADFEAGVKANVAGTPTFFVRNIQKNPGKFMVIKGPHPYAEVREVVQAAIDGRIIENAGSAVSTGSCPVDLK